MSEPLGPCNSRIGSLRTLAAGMPTLTSEGPRPRRTTGLEAFPRMMKPPIMTLSPTSSRRRVEMFNAWAGVPAAVAVGVAVAVGAAVAVAVAVTRGVAVAVAVAIGVAVAVAVAVGAAVAVAVAVGAAVAVAVAVALG